MASSDTAPVTLLPDPSPRPVKYTIISVDDHLIEPPDMFEDRLPPHLADRAPRVVATEQGGEAWLYEDNLYPNVGLNAVVGRPRDEWSMEPARFDQMRPGCWDIKSRIKDMDINGVWASLCFPSLIAGFCGSVFSKSADQELGLATMRAWNDWHLEVWAGSAPERIIPLQIPWLADPLVAADEIRHNAQRGFRAVSFAEHPVQLGIPSLHSGHWDPFLAACEETGTVICLHTGSSAWAPITAPDAPFEAITSLFPANALIAANDWLWSGVPLRYPGINIAFSEGGIGWVAMLADRADYVLHHSASGNESGSWKGDLLPSEVMRRNFWFCSIEDPSGLELRHNIGVERIMVESDYPHADSTWPDTQMVIERNFGHLPDNEVRMMTHENAAKLFCHPLPREAQAGLDRVAEREQGASS